VPVLAYQIGLVITPSERTSASKGLKRLVNLSIETYPHELRESIDVYRHVILSEENTFALTIRR
jgi:hypothetical protein